MILIYINLIHNQFYIIELSLQIAMFIDRNNKKRERKKYYPKEKIIENEELKFYEKMLFPKSEILCNKLSNSFENKIVE